MRPSSVLRIASYTLYCDVCPSFRSPPSSPRPPRFSAAHGAPGVLRMPGTSGALRSKALADPGPGLPMVKIGTRRLAGRRATPGRTLALAQASAGRASVRQPESHGACCRRGGFVSIGATPTRMFRQVVQGTEVFPRGPSTEESPRPFRVRTPPLRSGSESESEFSLPSPSPSPESEVTRPRRRLSPGLRRAGPAAGNLNFDPLARGHGAAVTAMSGESELEDRIGLRRSSRPEQGRPCGDSDGAVSVQTNSLLQCSLTN